jgi:hypothetical protein
MPISAAVGELVIAYDGDEVRLRQFLGDGLPRQRVGTVSVGRSALGVGYSSGPPVTQRFLWAVSAVLSRADRDLLETIVNAWDTARATGALPMPVITVVDGLTGTSSTERDALLSEFPEYNRLGSQWGVSMVLAEV